MSKRILALAFVLCAVAAVAGCESIAGIEDRTYDLGKTASPQCIDYCETALANCIGKNALYSGMDTCLGVCALLPPGDPLEPAGNTVACRAAQAELASSTGEPALHCPRAGPGGANHCGRDCESYCILLDEACPVESRGAPNCVTKCAALRDTKGFDVLADHEKDSLQCRLVHVSSATVKPVDHCPHAQFRPSAPWCYDKDLPPLCEDYCRIVTAACTDQFAQYESKDQCMQACAALPVGEIALDDDKTDTVGCRIYHSYSSISSPETHCSHSGPGGDGHCGTSSCPSYCSIVKAACPAQFGSQYPLAGQCETECAGLPGAGLDRKFSVTNTEETISCRMLSALRAFEDPTQCGAALGTTDDCPSP
ncbi:MAG TPA: hypothetical protein VI072_24475 [Polyangiaceae bacterium]